jgi:hypothetical protein
MAKITDGQTAVEMSSVRPADRLEILAYKDRPKDPGVVRILDIRQVMPVPGDHTKNPQEIRDPDSLRGIPMAADLPEADPAFNGLPEADPAYKGLRVDLPAVQIHDVREVLIQEAGEDGDLPEWTQVTFCIG